MRKSLKFGNKITELDGVKFRSKGEANRYQELKLLQKAGKISDLKLQVKHDLKSNGEKVGTYTSDFEYFEKPELKSDTFLDSYIVIEDFKGAVTPLFSLKWNILKSMYRTAIKVGTMQFRLTNTGKRYGKRR